MTVVVTPEEFDNPKQLMRLSVGQARTLLFFEPEWDDVVPHVTGPGFYSSAVFVSEDAGALEALKEVDNGRRAPVLMRMTVAEAERVFMPGAIDSVFTRRGSDPAVMRAAQLIAGFQVVAWAEDRFLDRFEEDTHYRIWHCPEKAAVWLAWDKRNWQGTEEV